MSNTTDLLNKIQKDYQKFSKKYQQRIIICAGTGCVANGALKIYDKLKTEIEKHDINVDLKLRLKEAKDLPVDKHNVLISKSGCQGFCQVGPLLEVQPAGYLYVKVTVDDVEEIVEKTILENQVIDRLLYVDPKTNSKSTTREENPFYSQQTRTVLKKCGSIDAESLEEYISIDGYKGAKKTYLEMEAADVCKEIEESGIRGRGGGGFPTGFKWKMALKEDSDKKYVICNGDEGDPGAFMDRSLFEGTPHSVIEGMMIAARAIGADEGYIYIRMEYPLAVKRIRKAVKEAEEIGVLGDNVFGSGYNFRINVMEGAGAFVCGEETALMASVEGKRGMPMPKPPYPSQSGLFGKPSVINNVETLATVPDIILKGAGEFRKVGTDGSPGTKTFALTGHVVNTGLIEVPFGTTLRKIIFDIGGGVVDKEGKINNDAFKAVQIGGPSGGCLTEKHLDIPLDFDTISKLGAMIGSGGLVVMNDSTCMITIAKYFMEFTQEESCGKCVLCREGTKQMLNLLDDITEGNASMKTLDTLAELGDAICKGSLCGLGKTAPNPVLSTMEQFEAEYLAHVKDKICPTRECSALSLPVIDAELCKGCTLCMRKCPVDAIRGKVKEPHVIIEEKCVNCGTCIDVCKFNAIS
ncbi:MAG: NADH-ubiquinone oxidoreductase-F iron-sulfur binding region domain-containing protein [Fidelibacterota bacterium]